VLLTVLAATAGLGAVTAQDAASEEAQPAAAPTPPTGARAMRGAALEEIRADEMLHRERLATIHRLGELAEQQGQAERLAWLDKLEVKENARYHRQFERRRLQVNDSTFRKAQLVLGKGRVRAATAEEMARRAARVVPEERQRKRRERLDISPDDPRIKRAAEEREKRSRPTDAAQPKDEADQADDGRDERSR
jgi:hypothetical protein